MTDETKEWIIDELEGLLADIQNVVTDKSTIMAIENSISQTQELIHNVA